jgi:hypothetical protein
MRNFIVYKFDIFSREKLGTFFNIIDHIDFIDN